MKRLLAAALSLCIALFVLAIATGVRDKAMAQGISFATWRYTFTNVTTFNLWSSQIYGNDMQYDPYNGNSTMTLDSSKAVVGQPFDVWIGATASATHALTINATNSATINGASTKAFTTVGSGATFIYGNDGLWYAR